MVYEEPQQRYTTVYEEPYCNRYTTVYEEPYRNRHTRITPAWRPRVTEYIKRAASPQDTDEDETEDSQPPNEIDNPYEVDDNPTIVEADPDWDAEPVEDTDPNAQDADPDNQEGSYKRNANPSQIFCYCHRRLSN